MSPPNILVIAGHDPSGGAGIQADIESAAANGAHAATVITLLTCQDTQNVHGVLAVDDTFFERCLETAVADMSFAAIKTGAIANANQVALIAALARRLPNVPLIVDPVLRAAGGGALADDTVGLAIRRELLPLADVITPNASEARLLCDNTPDLDDCGAELGALTQAVLITGGDEGEGDVVNHGFMRDAARLRYSWPRLAGTFHGSGCTLASAIAARRACGEDRLDALAHAQEYTWHALKAAFAAGRGQRIPGRLPAPGPA